MANELFWNASVEELTRGYTYDSVLEKYTCLFCEESFEEGIIYPIDSLLLEAKRAVSHHINEEHQSPFDYLLQLDKKYTGLSVHQKELLYLFKKGLNDKEIMQEMKVGSTSTIRNHRFKLKEREKQAKVYLAIMNLLKKETNLNKENDFIHFHKGAKMVDERYAITVEEREKVLSTYFKNGLDGKLDTFPSKEKRKIIVLQHIVRRFETNKEYSEKEVNDNLKTIYDDFVTLRRYLIEYGFMQRNRDGSRYWLSI